MATYLERTGRIAFVNTMMTRKEIRLAMPYKLELTDAAVQRAIGAFEEAHENRGAEPLPNMKVGKKRPKRKPGRPPGAKNKRLTTKEQKLQRELRMLKRELDRERAVNSIFNAVNKAKET
jgi:hypothetical protein